MRRRLGGHRRMNKLPVRPILRRPVGTSGDRRLNELPMRPRPVRRPCEAAGCGHRRIDEMPVWPIRRGPLETTSGSRRASVFPVGPWPVRRPRETSGSWDRRVDKRQRAGVDAEKPILLFSTSDRRIGFLEGVAIIIGNFSAQGDRKET
ncbi:hypothetical protein OROHE_013479 [Orobanche hederae]